MTNHRKHTSTLLRELSREAEGQLMAEGYDALADFVSLLQSVVASHPELARPLRSELLRIINDHEWLLDASDYLRKSEMARCEYAEHTEAGGTTH